MKGRFDVGIRRFTRCRNIPHIIVGLIHHSRAVRDKMTPLQMRARIERTLLVCDQGSGSRPENLVIISQLPVLVKIGTYVGWLIDRDVKVPKDIAKLRASAVDIILLTHALIVYAGKGTRRSVHLV